MAVHETDTPAFCSACFNQQPDKRHIDFDAAWDGPVIDAQNGMKQTIDDLVICQVCIESAARILGWVPASEDDTSAKLLRLEGELREARKVRAEQADRLERIRASIVEVDPATLTAKPPRKTAAR
jgi:hypothetical protein